MKTNAIIRIILLSLAIVILSGILVVALFGTQFSFLPNSEIEAKVETIEINNTRTIDASTIRELEIEWANGSIILEPVAETDQLTVQESGASSDEYHTVWTVSEDRLYIGFSEDYLKIPTVGFHESITKNLIIQVPIAWYCQELSIEAASADVTIRNLTIDELDFDGASGKFTFDNCTVRNLDIKTASGDVTFNGSLNELDYSGMSANFQGNLQNKPQELTLESMSGTLNICLPDDCGFTLVHSSVSGQIHSEFDTHQKNNHLIHGDGSCEITVKAMSGDVHIRKHNTSETTTNQDCNDPNCTDSNHSHSTECVDSNCTDSTHNHQINHNNATTHHKESDHH